MVCLALASKASESRRKLCHILFWLAICCAVATTAETRTSTPPVGTSPTTHQQPSTPQQQSSRGWFFKLRDKVMGNTSIGRAMTYSISKQEAKAIAVLDFQGTPLSWFSLDDPVMGGRSETTHFVSDDNILHFDGTVNTNGGGFTSIRAKLSEGLLTPQQRGLKIQYRGDGKTYKVLLSNGDRGGPFSRVPSWQADLPTIKHDDSNNNDHWDEAVIPFDKLVPAFGGGPRSQPSEDGKKQYKFDPSEMKEIGFMLSLRLSDGSPNPPETFGTGIFPFSLLVKSILAV